MRHLGDRGAGADRLELRMKARCLLEGVLIQGEGTAQKPEPADAVPIKASGELLCFEGLTLVTRCRFINVGDEVADDDVPGGIQTCVDDLVDGIPVNSIRATAAV